PIELTLQLGSLAPLQARGDQRGTVEEADLAAGLLAQLAGELIVGLQADADRAEDLTADPDGRARVLVYPAALHDRAAPDLAAERRRDPGLVPIVLQDGRRTATVPEDHSPVVGDDEDIAGDDGFEIVQHIRNGPVIRTPGARDRGAELRQITEEAGRRCQR